ncbi:helix-turn-helix domain-containing protein [Thalassoglobus sp.]|uniref:helix-turn-helix domain-containing protein n=1 Tax=Thalassoglobus sp. TaxID=2795869 RepID=UPI003AA8383B
MVTPLRQHDQHSFLVLPENRFAVAAIQRLAPVTRHRTVQCVTLIGPPGTGKSRLARELIRSWEASRSDAKIISVTASEFAAQLAQASSESAIHQFQRRYRHEVSLFICEDVQSLTGRNESQQQLVAAIDEVMSQGGAVLLTSTLMPSGIRGLSSRLASRIRGGLCADISLPEVASRRKLLNHFLTTESLRLTDQDVHEIAKSYQASPRELAGILQQIKTLQKTKAGQLMSAPELIEALHISRKYSLPEIASATARVYGVRVVDLKSPRRSKTISQARQVAMYLTRELTDLKYQTVGEYFGRGNHSTVIHACKKIATQRKGDPVLSHHIESIEKRLLNKMS